jgi:hypothetical protein
MPSAAILTRLQMFALELEGAQDNYYIRKTECNLKKARKWRFNQIWYYRTTCHLESETLIF